MTLPDDSFIGRMLAFVRPEGDQGPILVADGAYAGEIRAGGWDISDHDMPVPTSAPRAACLRGARGIPTRARS